MQDKQVKKAIKTLNEYAERIHKWAWGYGLPIHGAEVSTLREILYKWVAKHFGDR